jgi:PRKCA-binding protein
MGSLSWLSLRFSFQSYCLKVKEMDDEEYSYAALQESLYRVETGNYEYRYGCMIIQSSESL